MNHLIEVFVRDRIKDLFSLEPPRMFGSVFCIFVCYVAARASSMIGTRVGMALLRLGWNGARQVFKRREPNVIASALQRAMESHSSRLLNDGFLAIGDSTVFYPTFPSGNPALIPMFTVGGAPVSDRLSKRERRRLHNQAFAILRKLKAVHDRRDSEQLARCALYGKSGDTEQHESIVYFQGEVHMISRIDNTAEVLGGTAKPAPPTMHGSPCLCTGDETCERCIGSDGDFHLRV